MSTDDLTKTIIVVAVALIAGSFVIGLLGRWLLVRALAKRTEDTPGRTRDLFLHALSKVVLTWSVIAGLYGASIALPLRPALDQIATKVLLALAILTGTVALARISGGSVKHYAARHERLPGATSIFANIARVFVLAIGFLVALQTLGVSVGPVLAALGVGGLAVALALQDTLSNLFAGLHVIGSRKILPGDYVMLDSGEEGYVEDVNWRNTTLRNLRNNSILVPNARLASATLTNYYQPAAEMSILVDVGVSYDSDLVKVEEVTKQVGREIMHEVEGGVPDYEPLMRFHTFSDFSINFSVVLRVKEHTDQYLVKHEFVKRLHQRYRREGIQIPYPIRTLVFSDDSDPRTEEMMRAQAGSR